MLNTLTDHNTKTLEIRNQVENWKQTCNHSNRHLILSFKVIQLSTMLLPCIVSQLVEGSPSLL